MRWRSPNVLLCKRLCVYRIGCLSLLGMFSIMLVGVVLDERVDEWMKSKIDGWMDGWISSF